MPGVFAAGEVTGIGGVTLAVVEGEIAGAAAAGRRALGSVARQAPPTRFAMPPRGWSARSRSAPSSARSPGRHDRLPVRGRAARGARVARATARQAKLYARAGMGACQGRVCGPALEFLFGWQAGTVRFAARAGAVVYPVGAGRALASVAPAPDLTSPSSRIMTMQQRDWAGVFSAITTPFASDLSVDHAFLREHASWLVDNGCTGIVALGSLGESATLSFDEKVAILESCPSAPSAIAFRSSRGSRGLSTAECVALARRAASVGM